MVAACHHVALLSPTAALLKLGLSPYGEGAGPTEAGQVRRGTERGDEPSFRSGGIAKARTSRGTPLSPVDAQHCNSRDFAGLLGALSATRSGTAGAPSPLGCNGGERERKRRRVWGEHLRRRSQARPRHAQPGSILCASWVKKMSLTGARLVPPRGQAGWVSER